MPAARLLLPPPGRRDGPPPQMVLLADPSAVLDRAVLRLSNPRHGTVVAVVSPMTQSVGRLYGDILHQLGKGRWTAPESRVAEPERFWTQSWLRGWNIRRVVLHAADLLDDEVLTQVAGAIADAGAAVWFTFATTGAMLHATGILRGDPHRLDSTALVTLLAQKPEPARVVRGHPDLLDEQGIAAFSRHPDTGAVVSQIRRCADGSALAQRLPAVMRLRQELASQGWQLEIIDQARLLDPLLHNPLRLPADWPWERLHRLRDTAMPAAAAIAAAGASVLEMLALRSTNIAPDGASVGVAGDVLPIPPAARIFLRTRIAAVELLGRDTPFLADDWGKVIGPRQLRTTVCATFEEGGLAIPRLAGAYRHDPDRRWLDRNGLQLTSTPRSGRAAVLFRRPGRRDYSHTYRTPDGHPWRRWRRSSDRPNLRKVVR